MSRLPMRNEASEGKQFVQEHIASLQRSSGLIWVVSWFHSPFGLQRRGNGPEAINVFLEMGVEL